jgi:5-hydroxyisourate hydrolase
MGISTHVLDTTRGKPAAGLGVQLDYLKSGSIWEPLASSMTDNDGRCRDLAVTEEWDPGTYRLTFDTGTYFSLLGIDALYPEIVITFQVRDPQQHYHIPLLMGSHTYTTYRGS